MKFFLLHPWEWHRTPRSLRVNAARVLGEVALLAAVLAVLAIWPWSPVWPAAARAVLGVAYTASAAAVVATMRIRRRS
jgi:hypothetical protein